MTAIYHITHIRNLPYILANGGLWCDQIAAQRGLAQVGIAHQHIKERRARKTVPCAPGGVLADYVPFYFAPRSPMLFAIHKGNVQGYREGQGLILHLVSSVETVQAAGLHFAFSDGHAEMDISRYFTEVQDLNEVDWDIMDSHFWANTLEDGDRKRRRQAEFLVHQFFPFAQIETIGVINQGMEQQISALLQALPQKPVIQAQPAWYY